MINLRTGHTEAVIFTGTELSELTNPFFLFIFTHRLTGEVVKVMATNESTTDRFDEFDLVVDDYFSELGVWGYEVREKADSGDMTVTGNIVETGYMTLAGTEFAPNQYQGQTDTVITYNG